MKKQKNNKNLIIAGVVAVIVVVIVAALMAQGGILSGDFSRLVRLPADDSTNVKQLDYDSASLFKNNNHLNAAGYDNSIWESSVTFQARNTAGSFTPGKAYFYIDDVLISTNSDVHVGESVLLRTNEIDKFAYNEYLLSYSIDVRHLQDILRSNSRFVSKYGGRIQSGLVTMFKVCDAAETACAESIDNQAIRSFTVEFD